MNLCCAHGADLPSDIHVLFRECAPGILPAGSATGPYDLRLTVEQPLLTPAIRTALRRGLRAAAGIPVSRVWLVLGDAQVRDWRGFRCLWEYFCSECVRWLPQHDAVGLSATSLIIPWDQEGHLSGSFLKEISRQFLDARDIWVGVPVNPIYAEWYLAKSDIGDDCHLTVFETLRHLDFKLQAEGLQLQSPTWMVLQPEIEMPLPLAAAEFVSLLGGVDSVRLEPEDTPIAAHLKDVQRVDPANRFNTPQPAQARTPVANKVFASRPMASLLLKDTTINKLELIEILLLLEGQKRAVRVSGPPRRMRKIVQLAEALGLHWELGPKARPFRRDRGKGGWSNLFASDLSQGTEGEPLLYLSANASGAREALFREESSDELFGEILGYPTCCRAAYSRNFTYSLCKQGDLVPIVADQTSATTSWPFELNAGARYFDASLISFFPCTYTCGRALNIAQNAFAVIEEHSSALARELRQILRSVVLYTEYQGVYLFPCSVLDREVCQYDPATLLSTTQNRIAASLLQGDQLVIREANRIAIERRGKTITTIGGDNVRLMNFCLDTIL